MKIPFTGGCECGAIRYECSAEPIMMFKCHCRDCQKVTGGGFVAGLLAPASAFRLTKGQLRYHFTPSMASGIRMPQAIPAIITTIAPIITAATTHIPADMLTRMRLRRRVVS